MKEGKKEGMKEGNESIEFSVPKVTIQDETSNEKGKDCHFITHYRPHCQ
jgi:hypothetical protein